MKTPQQKLSDHFEVAGWGIEKIIMDDLDWWADEIWILKSIWSPEDAMACITFLVDPMFEGNRKKGEAVWGVGCCKEWPKSRNAAESIGVISLKSGLKNKIEIEGFLDKLEKIRAET
jgi:hypothetical protein